MVVHSALLLYLLFLGSVHGKTMGTVLSFNKPLGTPGYVGLKGFEEVDLPSWTVCIRVRPKVLAKSSMIFDIPQYPDNDENRQRLLQFKISDPEYNFVHVQGSSFLVRIGYKQNLWNNICCYFDYEKQESKFYINEKEQILNITGTKASQTNLTTKHLKKSILGVNTKNLTSFLGNIADLNIWKGHLEEDMIKKWIKCQTTVEGDIHNDSIEKYTWCNVTINSTEINCQRSKPGILWIPKLLNFSQAQHHCEDLGGVMQKLDSVTISKNLNSLIKSCDKESYVVWSGYTKENESEYLSQTFYAEKSNWATGEPNGEELEQCITINTGSNLTLDSSCHSSKPFFCWIEEYVSFRLRNLNRNGIDEVFYFNKDLKDGEVTFFGVTQDVIEHGDNGDWELKQFAADASETILRLENKELPIGVNDWKYKETDERITLSFDRCTDEEYNCDTGDCISMNQRCNGWADCTDNSDEIDCTKVIVPTTYDKTLPPDDKNVLPGIDISVPEFLLVVNSISDTDLKIELDITLKWRDSRITFLGLSSGNETELTDAEVDKIWFPDIHAYQVSGLTKSDRYIILHAYTDEPGIPSSFSRIRNTLIFNGKNVDIIFRLWYDKVIMSCPAEQIWKYPFDMRKCVLEVYPTRADLWTTLTSDLVRFVNLPNDAGYKVKKVDRFEINSFSLKTDKNGNMIATLILIRGFFPIFLQYILPYIVLSSTIYSTNVYYSNDLGWALTVNITALLAMTAFYASVIGEIQSSSSVKIIDMIQIKHILVGSLILFLQTLSNKQKSIQLVQTSEKRQIAWKGNDEKSIQVQNDNEEVHKIKDYINQVEWIAKFGIPGIGIIIDVLFLLLGILHQCEVLQI